MAFIEVPTSIDEQIKVTEAIRKLQGRTVSMTAIAREAGMNPNRVRFVIEDLESLGRIKRIPTKAFNPHYIRYKYEVLEKFVDKGSAE